MAFLGALISLIVIYVMTTRRGRTPVAMLLLAGLGLNAILSAATSFLISSGGVRYEIALEVVFWLMGGLDSRTWSHVWMCAPGVIVGLAVSLYFTRDLDLFLTGEDTAASLGVEVERVKRAVLVTSALLTGSAVAVSGIVGFVGLIVPHIVRFTLGPSHARVVPAAALAGASFLVACDLLARTLMRPRKSASASSPPASALPSSCTCCCVTAARSATCDRRKVRPGRPGSRDGAVAD